MFRTQKGFTLIELMIVVVIIGVLAAISIPSYVAMQNRAKEGSTKANMHTLQLAAEDYGVQNDGVYAGTMDATHIGNLLPANYKNPFSAHEGRRIRGRTVRTIHGSPKFIRPGVRS